MSEQAATNGAAGRPASPNWWAPYEFSGRLRNVLRNELEAGGVKSLEEARARTEQEWLRTPNFGRKSFKELVEAIGPLGVKTEKRIVPQFEIVLPILPASEPVVLTVHDIPRLAWLGYFRRQAQTQSEPRLTVREESIARRAFLAGWEARQKGTIE
jgi:hypothetical protein